MGHSGPRPFRLSDGVRAVLERISRSSTAPVRLVERTSIVLMSERGLSNRAQARKLGCDHQRVRRWRRRWEAAVDGLAELEARGETGKKLESAVVPRKSGDP